MVTESLGNIDIIFEPVTLSDGRFLFAETEKKTVDVLDFPKKFCKVSDRV